MKILLKVLAGVVLVIVVAAGALVLLFDPNDFKPEIEALAREQASVELKIDGDIGWSLFPTLGLQLPRVEAKTLEGEPLASLQKAQLSVSVMALLGGELKMNGVLLDGLQLAIVAPPADQAEAGKAGEAEPGKAGDGGAGLKLDIGSVDIRNARISYEDPSTGQKMLLSEFNFSGQNVTSERAFPAQMDFKLELYQDSPQPELSVQAELEADLLLDTVTQVYQADGLDLKVQLRGAAFAAQTVPLALRGNLLADLGADKAWVNGLALTLASLKLQADLELQQLTGKPVLAGKLDIAAFDLNQLLTALGQAAVATTDSNALQQVALSARLEGPANTVGLKDLQLQLDDSRFTGQLAYDLGSGAQTLKLQGDQLNIDRYLPPASPSSDAPAAQSGSVERYPKTPLLPVDVLQSLTLDADIGLQQLQAAGLKLSSLQLLVSARNGLVKVSKMSGDLYDGSFSNSATLDARKQPLTLKIDKQVSQIQLGGLLQDLAQQDKFSGVFDMKGSYAASGNSVYDIVHSLDGNMQLSVKDGRLQGVNLVDKLCSGILQLQGKTVDASAAVNYTEFSNLSGSVKMTKGVLDNRDLKAALVGVNLAGAGQVDLPKEALDYGLSLTVLQELKGPNCQLDSKLHNISFPLRCQGGFDDAPTKMCGPDKAGMTQLLADVGLKDVEAKVEAVKQEAKAKVEEKKQAVKEKLESKIEGKLKGLFN